MWGSQSWLQPPFRRLSPRKSQSSSWKAASSRRAPNQTASPSMGARVCIWFPLISGWRAQPDRRQELRPKRGPRNSARAVSFVLGVSGAAMNLCMRAGGPACGGAPNYSISLTRLWRTVSLLIPAPCVPVGVSLRAACTVAAGRSAIGRSCQPTPTSACPASALLLSAPHPPRSPSRRNSSCRTPAGWR
jgi:hypothetical protein